MSLQLVLGSSGAGKSYALYQEMISGARESQNTNIQYLVLVPEQFTMQTQKDIISMHPERGAMNLDILSFMRLAHRVFDEIGVEDKPVLEDLGKSMVVRKVLEVKRKELTFFQSNVRKVGFVSELKSLLSEFFQYGIEEEEIEKMIKAADKKPLLQKKLEDVEVVYKGFKEYLAENYITAEGILDVLCDVVPHSSLIRNSVICFDSFTGFTPSQYRLLGKLFSAAKKVYVTITIDPREEIARKDGEHKLFYLSKKTVLKLYQMAEESKVEIEEEMWIPTEKGISKEKEAWILKANDTKDTKVPYRFRNSPPLAALEHNLFRYPYDTYREEQNDISIHSCRDSVQEVNYTVEEILRLVREEGYRYRDIAVVTGDIALYAALVEKAFTEANFSFFIDYKKDILSNPMVELLRSLLEIFRKNFDYESVFRYLRCGLVDICEEDVDKLENYVLALGIRGYQKWNKQWKRIYRKDVFIELEEINRIREAVMAPLLELKEGFLGKSTIESYTRHLYQYLEQQNIFAKIELYCKKFASERMPLQEKEYRQIYTLVLEIFDQLVELLGQEEVSIKEYEELLDTGFSEEKVGLIPPRVDQIVVGDMERTRLKDIKALFCIGVNDGIVPKGMVKGGIISDLEREMLHEKQIELAPTRRQSAYIEQFYLYLNLTKPQNRLYLTYAKVGMDGKAKSPSYLIGKIQKLFPNLLVQEEDLVREEASSLLGADFGMTYLLEGIRRYSYEEMPDSFKELFSYYLRQKDFRQDLLHFIKGAFYTNEKSPLSKTVANILYGKELHNSVTRLERYAACAFAHFLAYGLELKERQKFHLNLPDVGNIFHNAIEIFSKKVEHKGILWHDLTDELRDSLAEEAVKEATVDYGNTILFSSKRNEYMIKRVERMTKRTLWALCEHIKQGEFEPSGYEVLFSPEDNLEATSMCLGKNEFLRLKGRIDRVDLSEKEGELYVKIIDYKSGSTEFELLKIYHGLQLQLVVYLNAALELEQKKYPEKTVIPAGIFYYNIEDPIIDKPCNEASEEEVREQLLNALKMNGLANEDREILKRLDIALEEGAKGKSQIIPVDFTAKGEFSARSQVASTKNFHTLSQHVQKKMKQYGQEILEGEIQAEPYYFDKRTPCDYCDFQKICNFDKKLPGNKYRMLKNLDKELIWEELKGENGD